MDKKTLGTPPAAISKQEGTQLSTHERVKGNTHLRSKCPNPSGGQEAKPTRLSLASAWLLQFFFVHQGYVRACVEDEGEYKRMSHNGSESKIMQHNIGHT